jgi:hypothetical protein
LSASNEKYNMMINNKQLFTNIGIFAAIFIILFLGVRFATWSASQWSSGALRSPDELAEGPLSGAVVGETAVNTETTASVLDSLLQIGEIILNISAKENVSVREVYFYNVGKEDWLQVYDGYRDVTSAPQELYRFFLSPSKYSKIKVVAVGGEEKILEKEIVAQNGVSVTVDIGL